MHLFEVAEAYQYLVGGSLAYLCSRAPHRNELPQAESIGTSPPTPFYGGGQEGPAKRLAGEITQRASAKKKREPEKAEDTGATHQNELT